MSADWTKRTWDVDIPEGVDAGRFLSLQVGGPAYLHAYLSSPTSQAMPADVRAACMKYLAPDKDSVAKATKKSTLDWSPKKNWVDHAGGLPKYIEEIALALIRDHGMPRERAIPVAINRVKLWAGGGGGVKADTRVKAAKALAQWEAMKAKARAKKD